jgi:hypothetical protein
MIKFLHLLVNFVCFKNNAAKLLLTPLTTLKKFVTTCSGPISGDCNAATARYCQSIGYEAGGFGPSEFDGTNVTVICFKSPNGFALNTTFSVLSSINSACISTANVNSIACNSAVKNFCVSKNYKSGYGILEHNGDAAVIGCAN